MSRRLRFGPLMVGLLLAGCTRMETSEPTGFGVGKPAPEIEGEDVDGKPMRLSDYRGKVVLLDFWGNW
jgi:hypothetical protein